jgi:hypothetical protein
MSPRSKNLEPAVKLFAGDGAAVFVYEGEGALTDSEDSSF